MCGRIAQAHTPDELAELLGVSTGLDRLYDISPSYNVPPSSLLPALIPDATGNPAWSSFTWGFLPAWKRDGRALINARSETVAAKPMFKGAFSHRRCVLPVTAYYEWRKQPGQPKQPYCIRSDNDHPLLLAGIHENETCAVLTRPARADLAYIHDRMPVLLPHDLLAAYLDAPDPSAAATVFHTAEQIPLLAYPVTRSMGNPTYNNPSCLEPLS